MSLACLLLNGLKELEEYKYAEQYPTGKVNSEELLWKVIIFFTSSGNPNGVFKLDKVYSKGTFQ